MKLLSCLLVVAGLWSMLLNDGAMGQASLTFSAQAANPIKDVSSGLNYATVQGPGPALSGVVDHGPGSKAGNELLYLTTGNSSIGYGHSFAWTTDGGYYQKLSSTAAQSTLNPFIVRLYNGSAYNYLFSSPQTSPNSLFVDISNKASNPQQSGFINLNFFPRRFPVYNGAEPIRSVSATVLNSTFYIAINWKNSGKITILRTDDFININDMGYAATGQVPILSNSDVSIFAAQSPDSTQVGGTIFLYHACDLCQAGALAARVIRATNPTVASSFDQTTSIIVNDAQIINMVGTAVTVAADYQTVLIVRAGYDPTAAQINIYWATVNTPAITRSSEATLTDAASSSIAVCNNLTPAIIYDRFAGAAATSGPVTIVWANAGDNLLYAVTGNPFP